MNPFARVRLLWKVWSAYDDAVAAAQKETPVTKSIFASKVFWFNILAGATQFANLVPQPWGALVVAAINIGLRYVTTQPVAITAPIGVSETESKH